MVAAPAPAPATAGDTSRHIPAGLPGSATLFIDGKDQLQNGAYTTARMAFDQLLSAYPNSIEAPAAQFLIGQSYTHEGNTAAADSVYQLFYTRYPKSADAPTAMYRHGTFLWDAEQEAGSPRASQSGHERIPELRCRGAGQELFEGSRQVAELGCPFRSRTLERCPSSITSRSFGGASSIH